MKQAKQFQRLQLAGFGGGDADEHEEKGVRIAVVKSRTEKGEIMDQSGSYRPHIEPTNHKHVGYTSFYPPLMTTLL